MRLSHLPLLVIASIALLGTIFLAEPVQAQHEFIGAAKCKKCHLKQYRSWEETKMAKTFETLKPGVAAEAKTAAGLDPDKDYTRDAECVGCHTTGYGLPTGFVDIDTTPELAGVGCEMCHGAGGTYIQDEYKSLKNKEYVKSEIVAVGLVDTVSEEQCVSCHNSDSPFVDDDFLFDFAANKEKGTHEHFPLKYKH